MKNSFDRIIDIFFYSAWALIIIIALMLYFCFPVKAASNNSSLPFIVQSNPLYINSSELDLLESQLSSFNVDLYDDNVIVFKYYESGWYNNSTYIELPVYRVLKLSGTQINAQYSSNASYQNFVLYDPNYYITATFNINGNYIVRLRETVQVQEVSNGATTFNKNILGSNTLTEVSSGLFAGDLYNSNYPIYISNNITAFDTVEFDNVLIIANGRPVIEGSVTEPDLNSDDIISGMSEPELNDYLPSGSVPSFDNSSTTAALESLYDYFNYYTSKITGYFNYLSDTIKYSAQKIIDNIKNVLKNFYDNLVSLFKPLLDGIVTLLSSIEGFVQSIKETIDYIVEPLDISSVSSSFNSTRLMTQYSNVVTFYNSVHSVFANTSEPDNFIIPIHLEDLSYFDLDTYYLDLGFHFKKFRTPFRAFCWVFCSFGAVFLVEHNLSSWLLGSSGGGGKIDN